MADRTFLVKRFKFTSCGLYIEDDQNNEVNVYLDGQDMGKWSTKNRLKIKLSEDPHTLKFTPYGTEVPLPSGPENYYVLYFHENYVLLAPAKDKFRDMLIDYVLGKVRERLSDPKFISVRVNATCFAVSFEWNFDIPVHETEVVYYTQTDITPLPAEKLSYDHWKTLQIIAWESQSSESLFKIDPLDDLRSFIATLPNDVFPHGYMDYIERYIYSAIEKDNKFAFEKYKNGFRLKKARPDYGKLYYDITAEQQTDETDFLDQESLERFIESVFKENREHIDEQLASEKNERMIAFRDMLTRFMINEFLDGSAKCFIYNNYAYDVTIYVTEDGIRLNWRYYEHSHDYKHTEFINRDTHYYFSEIGIIPPTELKIPDSYWVYLKNWIAEALNNNEKIKYHVDNCYKYIE